MIENKKDISSLLMNHCHINHLLAGADGGAAKRVFSVIGESLENIGYVLINKKDLENYEEKKDLKSTAGVSILDIGGS